MNPQAANILIRRAGHLHYATFIGAVLMIAGGIV